MSPIVASIIAAVVFGAIVTVISVRQTLKNPEKFQKESDEAYKKLNKIKTNITGNSLTWEEARKQAEAEIAAEEAKKAAKKAAKKNKK